MIDRRQRLTGILQWPGGQADVACLASGTLAVSAVRRISVFALDGTKARLRREIELPFVASELRISGSERWFLAIAAGYQRGWIMDLAADAAPTDIEALDERPALAGTFALLHGREVALVVRTRGRVDRYRLDTGTWDTSMYFPSFRLDELLSPGSSEHVVAVGRWDADHRIALGVIDADRHDDRAIEQLHRTTGVMDESERLCVGPCGPDGFVVFRDPAGYEEPDESPTEHDCRTAFWGLCGAYIRKFDGTVVQQVALAPIWERRAPAAGGPRTLAVAGKDAIHLIGRSTAHVTSIAARWLAASPDGGRVLVEHDDELALLDL